jgi:nucleotide-binding universal stress UspA family protein
MSESKKLVVVAGVAWDATAEPLWNQAKALVAMPNVTLYLCHVVGHQSPSAESVDIDRTMKKLQAWARERVDRDDPACARIHLEISIGDPATELVQTAVDHDADVLLLGTHARTGVAKLALGSIAEEVLHAAPCAVLIARLPDLERTKSPTVAPSVQPGQKGFRPHGMRYRSSVVFSSTDATRS